MLTKRENEVLSYMAKGLTNREISEILCISPYTMMSHVNNIYNKLGLCATSKYQNGTLRLRAVLWYLRENNLLKEEL